VACERREAVPRPSAVCNPSHYQSVSRPCQRTLFVTEEDPSSLAPATQHQPSIRRTASCLLLKHSILPSTTPYPTMSSPSWQDRRFMFPAGKEVHEGSARRMSGSSAATAESPVLTNAAPAAPTQALPEYPVVEKKVLSNPDAWGGNRLFMGRAGKEVHEPARRPSGSSSTKPEVTAPPKSSSPPAPGAISAAIAGRRRVCFQTLPRLSPSS
jgi:hypothetical protein